MLKLKTIALLLLSAASYTAHAQKTDYIIKNNGDTIKCKVRFVAFSSNIRFKTDTMKEYQEESASTIKQYFRYKEDYPQRSVLLPNKKEPKFLGLVEEGKINIYEKEVRSDRYTTYFWYVQKGDGPIIDVKNSALINLRSREDRQNDFIELISDNKEVLEFYKAAKKFNFKHIQATIHYYNTGEAPKPEVTEPAEPAEEPVTEGN